MAARRKFASQADGKLLGKMRALARAEGRHFQAVLEDAMREYLDRRATENPRQAVLDRFRASVDRNRRLGELLSK